MNRIIATALVMLSMPATGTSAGETAEPQIVSVRQIWDRGEHDAFTDLIRFRNRWWCTFREPANYGLLLKTCSTCYEGF